MEEQLGRTWLDSLEIEDIIRLRPLVLLEVTGLFESHNIPFNKRKARKRSRIKNGIYFNIPCQISKPMSRHIFDFS